MLETRTMGLPYRRLWSGVIALGAGASFAASLAAQSLDDRGVSELEARLGVRAGEPIQLFNGESLDGWTTTDGDPVIGGWEVQRGELVRAGRGGAIYAEGEYEDFALDFEWKIAPGCNSGVKYRVRFYEVGVWRRPGWLGCEYQIYDDQKKPDPLQSTGALYALYPPDENKRLRPPGEYNQSRIIVSETRIEHWLNGQRVVEADVSSDQWRRRVADSKFNTAQGFGENRRGRIQIQDHGGKVWFRSIVLRPLNAEPGDSPEAEGRAGRKPAP